MAAIDVLLGVDNMTVHAALLLVTLLVLYICKIILFQKHPGKKIPGPSLLRGMKIFLQGNRTNTLHHLVPQLAKEYGEMVQIDLLLRKAVFINDAETFKRLVKDSKLRELANDRPSTFYGKYFYNFKGVVFTDYFGSLAHRKRKLFHNLLKFYGEGKLQFEDHMLESLNKLRHKLAQQSTVDLHAVLHKHIANLVSLLLDGDVSDKIAVKSQSIVDYSFTGEQLFLFENETFLQPFPFLRFIPGLRFKKIYDATVGRFTNLLDIYFYSARDSFNPKEKRGIVDDLLEIQQKSKENGEEVLMDDESIAAMIGDLVSAGFLTTGSTLSTLFLNLIENPDIQDKIYKEIQTVIGDSVPGFQHRLKMPYTEAVIFESLRISGLLPFLLPHMARDDIVFDGYFIPKSSIILMNAWYCHHRSDYWEDPYRFKPERFLDVNGQLVPTDHPARQRLIPFGAGRRGCPGELFGRSRAFLITVFLVQKFQFLPPDNEALPSSDPRNWKTVTVMAPDNYRCKVKLRPQKSETA